MFGKVNDKIEVYAFSVVLLELLSGEKPINHDYKGQESLVMWQKRLMMKPVHLVIIYSHINVALGDVVDDSVSMCSVEQGLTLEEYLRGRYQPCIKL
ncbi:hypothetical protein VNO80_15771 [Phaseolus coccineus]|uniref:Serine-threonine/tyrosine-protein kinase catalytic domain-containing protein n=1 Tax=Phaseolus coccineus TaxID=3886 RepID=A0AAN9MS08_PHACN